MRLHGNRDPQVLPEQPYRDGIAQCPTGAPNEVWSYGEETGEILTSCLQLREKLKSYISKIMAETHEKNSPIMRTMFFEFLTGQKAGIFMISTALAQTFSLPL